MGKIKGALGQGVISVVDPQTGTKVFPASVHVIQQRGKPSQRLIKQKLKPQGGRNCSENERKVPAIGI